MSKFSTLNESSLHNTLKIFYATNYDGKMEVKKNGFIYDIFTKDNQAIEIQTKNLSSLAKKIKTSLENKIKITLVYPLPISTKIILTDSNGKLVYSRKSPKKANIYDLLKELTGIYDFLLHENFCLEVIYINIIEHRVLTDEPVQSKNNRRRHKKNWIKVNKKLDEIVKIEKFNSKEDYLKLLPPDLNDEFCAKDIKELMKKNKNIPSRIYNNANLITWLYFRMGILEETKTKNRSKYFKIDSHVGTRE